MAPPGMLDTQPICTRPHGMIMFGTGQGAGDKQSDVTLDLGDATAVCVEITPIQPSTTGASIVVLDAGLLNSAFTQTTDDSEYTPSKAANLFNTPQKFNVKSCRRYIKVHLYVTDGIWQATASPIFANNLAEINVSGTITANQGSAGASDWPVNVENFPANQAVTAADGALVTVGTTTDAATANSLVGLLKAVKAALQGTLTSAISGTVTVVQATAANLQATVTGTMSQVAAATGGATHTKVRNLAAVVQAIKAAAGTLYGVTIINGSAATCYVQLFDAATGSVTLGTTTPDLEFQVAAGATFSAILPDMGVAMTTAISAASTTTEGGATGSASGVQLFAQYA